MVELACAELFIILSGAIAVSRTIGDIELKYSKLVSATPEMKFVRSLDIALV